MSLSSKVERAAIKYAVFRLRETGEYLVSGAWARGKFRSESALSGSDALRVMGEAARIVVTDGASAVIEALASRVLGRLGE